MVSGKSSAQIITSKKEAQKKGVYSYSEKQKANTSINKKAVVKEVASLNNNEIVAYEPTVKKGGPNKSDSPIVRTNTTRKSKVVIEDNEDPDFTPSNENYLATQIVNNAMQFEGVRYRGGGTTKAGMDCSGMVYASFQIFDMTLPRSSHEMAKAGTDVELTEVRRGDLLFFANNRHRSQINHVGMVTEVTPEGEVKFLHSSTSSGVIVSSMNEAYHSRTFVKAKRVVED